MKEKEMYIKSTLLVVTGLSLLTGIIVAVFAFFLIAQQGVTPAAPSSAQPPISFSPTVKPTQQPMH